MLELVVADRDNAMRDTASHIRRVGEYLAKVVADLTLRAVNHDASKFSEDEWPTFAAITASLKGLKYGSEEYKTQLAKSGKGIKLHQERNSHHPEAHYLGIDGMTLLDLIEMLCDWKAAGERHADGGNIYRSIEINRERFTIDDQLAGILTKTAHALWPNS